MHLNDRDIELINLIQNDKKYLKDEIVKLSKEEILHIIDLIGDLIGYDSKNNDIDFLGEEADNLISKLLKILENRKEI